MELYCANACHVCKRTERARACSSCGAYRYCSRAHQAEHWRRSHRRLCAALAARRTLLRDELAAGRAWLEARLALKRALEKAAARPLSVAETQLWMFPRACEVCHETDPNELVDCPRCPAASFCLRHEASSSDDHRETCRKLRMQCEHYLRALREPDFDRNFPDTDDERLALETAFRTRFATSSDEDEDRLLPIAEKFGHAFTLLDAIAAYDDRTMVVHVVGAVREHFNFDRQICEATVLRFSPVEDLKLVFVGPELDTFADGDFRTARLPDGRTIAYDFHGVLYSEYHSSAAYSKPDVVAAFNCGFHEFANSPRDTWAETLPLLLARDVSLLFTSYTHDEAVQDFDALKANFEGRRVSEAVRCRRNDFRGRLPLRDWVNTNEFYYVNNYISVVKVV